MVKLIKRFLANKVAIRTFKLLLTFWKIVFLIVSIVLFVLWVPQYSSLDLSHDIKLNDLNEYQNISQVPSYVLDSLLVDDNYSLEIITNHLLANQMRKSLLAKSMIVFGIGFYFDLMEEIFVSFFWREKIEFDKIKAKVKRKASFFTLLILGVVLGFFYLLNEFNKEINIFIYNIIFYIIFVWVFVTCTKLIIFSESNYFCDKWAKNSWFLILRNIVEDFQWLLGAIITIWVALVGKSLFFLISIIIFTITFFIIDFKT